MTLRVVSLIASATETVAALGCDDWLVGRSHECDYPPAVRQLPVCSSAKIDVTGTSLEIDRQVKSLLTGGLSIYDVDTSLLQSLRPDVILTQSHCEVCAVSLRDVERVLGDLIGWQPRVVSLAPNCLADIWTGIGQIADALGIAKVGHDVVSQLQARLAKISSSLPTGALRPTVACIEWIDPLMAAGNWVPELVEIAGGYNLFGTAGRHSPWMTWYQLRAADPEVIIVLPCGWDVAKARSEMGALTNRAGWNDLRAVQSGRVILADGNQFMNRPGPRIVESTEILAEVLHPDLLNFGHGGTGWENWLPPSLSELSA